MNTALSFFSSFSFSSLKFFWVKLSHAWLELKTTIWFPFVKVTKKQAIHCIEYFQVIISFHQINCLDVHCDNPLSLSFTKLSQDMFTESQYAARMGNISGKSQCEDFRMDATFRSYPPTNEVGTCPWTFGKNVDNDRVPRELWEAKCACRCGLHRADCLQYRCVPVYTYVTVLRRKNCTTVTQEIFPLSVGCTQVRLIRRLDANQMIPWNVKNSQKTLSLYQHLLRQLIDDNHNRFVI